MKYSLCLYISGNLEVWWVLANILRKASHPHLKSLPYEQWSDFAIIWFQSGTGTQYRQARKAMTHWQRYFFIFQGR